ncbi:MAG: hypothetical protein WC023_06420 [Rhodocyclaceae bacterium]
MKRAGSKPFDFSLVLAQLQREVQNVPETRDNGDLLRNAQVFLMSIEEVITDLRSRVTALETAARQPK